jgi:hypothetical protein
VIRYGALFADEMSLLRFSFLNTLKVQSLSVQPSLVAQLTAMIFPTSFFSTTIAPPRASAWSVLCSAFEMFMRLSEMTQKPSAAAIRGALMKRLVRYNL